MNAITAMRVSAPLIVVSCLALIAQSVGAAGVSPGATSRWTSVDQPCPTFSWEAVAGAELYELVVYALAGADGEGTEVDLGDGIEVLYATVPGGASSWTPSSEQGLARGQTYQWFVRAILEVENGEVLEATAWSEGLYFRVPARPSPEEIARALEVLQLLAVDGGDAAADADRPQVKTPASRGSGSGSGSVSESVPAAAAAIRGDNPSVAEGYGVVGLTSSPDGAGVGAANLASGPDLVLDGSADGRTDTMLSESGIDRSSVGSELFSLGNSGGGTLNLRVAGYVSATGALSGNDVSVPYGLVVDDQGRWQGVGDTVPCTACVTSSDLADDSVTSAKIATRAVGSDHLNTSSVTSMAILDGTIATADLANGSVTSTTILDGTIATVDLADDSVTGAKIANRAVDSEHLNTSSVMSTAILDGTIATIDLANGSVTGAKIASDTITAADLAPDSVGSSEIADDAVGSAEIVNDSITGVDVAPDSLYAADLATNSVGSDEIAPGAVGTSEIADGSIIAADVMVNGGLYSSKVEIYARSTSTTDLGTGVVVVQAFCFDANDLPLQGTCLVSDPTASIDVVSTSASDWDNMTGAAGWACTFRNNLPPGKVFPTVSSTILCIVH